MKTGNFNFVGLQIQALSKLDLVKIVSEAVANRSRVIVGNHNLHSLYLCFNDPRMKAFYSLADYTHIDGMSLVLLGRVLGLPVERKHRTGYMDLLPFLIDEAEKREWRIYYLGGKPGVAKKAAQRLMNRCPRLQIRTRHGHFNAERRGFDNQAVLADIDAYSPDVLMVGMGMPRQEIWVLENLKELNARAIFCCGALMDYVAGEIPTPPRWIGQIGLEWLYRLVSEPGRLWRRYLVEPWSVMAELTRFYLASPTSRVEQKPD
jgi:N-acetylglucosaminyldiphosphoundecaprenol N-acetyl-beta-D-mannosaminyltransferase